MNIVETVQPVVSISKTAPVATLITAHACAPGDQQRLIDLLLEAGGTIYQHAPGFISATLHRAADGTRVTNYAQYRTRADFQALRANPAIPPSRKRWGGSPRGPIRTCTRWWKPPTAPRRPAVAKRGCPGGSRWSP